ncbi:MAG: restriction endonuclease subunit S, partial [Verrucomicrobiota bacterium]
NGTLMSYFLAAVAAGPAGRKYFLLASKQSTNLASVNSTQLKAFPIPLPTLPEQRKIAEILSTWDTAIEQTRNLIDAKKHRKKGLMQQLLTGKTRLPKFKTQKCTNEHESEIGWENKISHGWREARLNDIFSRVRRKVGERTDVEPLSITSTTGFVSQQKKFSRVIAGKQLKNYILLKKGEFAYNKGNSKSYPQGCIYRLNKYEKAAIPDVFYCFRTASGEIVPEFFEF